MASPILRDELSCSICMKIYTEPVTLRCGHNFCRGCIAGVLDSEKKCKVYSCPDCRAEFKDRPELCKNIVLSNIIDCLRCLEPKTAIFCTYCIRSPVPAVKTCLFCEASLCEDHLTVHSKSSEHVLCDPTTNLENRKCSVHRKILEYYCTQDSTCICVTYCVAGPHRGHQVMSLAEASEIKKKKLGDVLKLFTSMREKAKISIQSLERRRKEVKEKAGETRERVQSLFTDLRRRLNLLERRALDVLVRQELKVSSSAQDLIHHLEVQKDELSMKMSHLEELCNMTDPLTVLQDEEASRDTGGNTEAYDVGDINNHQISLLLHTGLSDLLADTNVWIHILKPEDFLLDVETASNNITLSEDLKGMSYSHADHNRPDTAERFDRYHALSMRVFSSGQHYWVVEIGTSRYLRLGVCYPSTCRKGYVNIGDDNKSWCLYRNDLYKLFSIHDDKATQLPYDVSSDRIGIYLNYESGQLSFYELSDPIRHLTTLNATFTEPLHAAFQLEHDGYIRVISGE
ncbi:E3 ubiquitin/ISG15 ligase TRIM25-like [Rhinoderma darwinii]|uniref:E3 ubiquitin/ISG15 ligase TRIM25-like n=1 Tax=Rhinoderma darwinii TaxID=43563 RepID=UPI003F6712DC